MFVVILCAQMCFYLWYALILTVLYFLFGFPVVLDLVWSPAMVSVSSSTGWGVILALAGTAFAV